MDLIEVVAWIRWYLLTAVRPQGITPFEVIEGLKAQGVSGCTANAVFRDLRLQRVIDADPATGTNLRWAGR